MFSTLKSEYEIVCPPASAEIDLDADAKTSRNLK